MRPIRVAIVGIGNCASSLVQGVAHYRETGSTAGLIAEVIGDYRVGDIEIVLGIDVDRRKVGRDVAEAIGAAPNNTTVFKSDMPALGAPVIMGRRLDGVAAHMEDAGERGFQPSDEGDASEADIVAALREAEVDVFVNFLPVGAQEASEFYMTCALEAGVAVVNSIPVFIATNSDPNALDSKVFCRLLDGCP